MKLQKTTKAQHDIDAGFWNLRDGDSRIQSQVRLITRLLPVLLVLCLFMSLSQAQDMQQLSRTASTSPFTLKAERKQMSLVKEQNRAKAAKLYTREQILVDLAADDYMTRVAACKTIGLIGLAEDAATLESLLMNDLEPLVRAEASTSLVLLNSKVSVPVLIKALVDADSQVRLKAAMALAYLGEKTNSFASLSSIWNNGTWQDKLNVDLGFREIGTPDAIQFLIAALNDPNDFVKADAAVILNQLGYEFNAFSTLQASLGSQDRWVRLTALKGLAANATDESILLIRSVTADSDELVRQRAQTILANLTINK